MKKRTKRTLIIAPVALVALLLLIPVLLALFFPEEKLREIVLPRASEALGREVDCSRIGLRFGLRGFELELEDLSLGADPGEFGLRAVDLPRLTTRLAWRPLLRREIRIESLHFEKPAVTLALAPPDAPRADAATGGEAALVAVAAPDVTLSDGVVRVIDPAGPAGPAKMELSVELKRGRFATAVSPDGGLTLTAALTLNVEQSLTDLSGRVEGIDIEFAGGLAEETLTIDNLAVTLAPLSLSWDRGENHFEIHGERLALRAAGRAPLTAFEATPPDLNALTCDLTLSGRDLAFNHRDCPDNVSAAEIACAVGLRQGEGGEVRIGELSIVRPLIDVTLPGPAVEGEAVAPAEAAPLVALALSAPRVKISEGRLKMRQTDGPTIIVDLPALDAATSLDVAGRVGFRVIAEALPVSVEQENTVDADLTLALDLAGGLTADAFELTRSEVRVSGLSLDAWPPDARGPLHADLASLALELAAAAPLTAFAGEKPDFKALNYTLSLDAAGAVVRTPTAPEPLEVTRLELSANPGIVDLAELRARADSTNLRLSGRVWSLLDDPRMELSLTGSLVDLADLLPPAAAETEAPAAAAADGADPAPVLPPLPPGTLDVEIAAFRHGLVRADNVRGRVLVSRSDVRFRDLSADMYDGTATGALRLSPTAAGDAKCVGDFHVLGVRAPAFLAAFTPVKEGIDGTLDTDIDLGLILLSRAHAAESPRPFRGLRIGSHARLRQGALLGSSAVHALCGLAGLPKKERYGLGDLNVTLMVENDRVTSDNIRFPLEGGRIEAKGSTGLDGTLDYRGTWNIGSRVMERLGSGSPLYYLRDEDGQVEIDFLVGGTLKSPSISLDQTALQERLRRQAEEALREEGSDLLRQGLDALKNKLR